LVSETNEKGTKSLVLYPWRWQCGICRSVRRKNVAAKSRKPIWCKMSGCKMHIFAVVVKINVSLY